MAKIREDLIGSVLIENPEGGDPIVLLAGADVPKGVKVGEHLLDPNAPTRANRAPSKPTKPAEPASSADASETDAGASVDADASSGIVDGDQVDGSDTSDPEAGASTDQTITAPPQSGAGSGIEAWRAYALASTTKAGLKIDIPADATRSDIIEALAAADIPTE